MEIHYIDDIQNDLGSPSDDYKNFFTARLLLLLESRPIFNDPVYNEIVEQIIGAYYRDYHDHAAQFRPIFLANDIIRFWKTLCLNYEHRRNRPTDDPVKRNEHHLKNLKLKFSRMLTCFSMVIALAERRETVHPDELIQLVYRTPFERLQEVARKTRKGRSLLRTIQGQYQWFLEATGRPQPEAVSWISEKEDRDRAFERARTFGNEIYALLASTTRGSDTLRYLVI